MITYKNPLLFIVESQKFLKFTFLAAGLKAAAALGTGFLMFESSQITFNVTVSI